MAGIIHRIAPAAELYSVRVFDESLRADGRALLAGLRWAIEFDMDVVNLSLGTTDPASATEMQALCQEAAKERVVLVAAAHNEGIDSFPAALPEVIGVQGADEVGGRMAITSGQTRRSSVRRAGICSGCAGRTGARSCSGATASPHPILPGLWRCCARSSRRRR